MTETTITIPRKLPAGEIVAMDVTEDDFMRDYSEDFYEWMDGIVIKVSPISGRHDDLTAYLRSMLDTYFTIKQTGKVRSAPFVMRLKKVNSRREPDLQVILHSNPGVLEDTYMDGAADICIEIVSLGTESIDYGDKFKEYEQGGVQEYWIIDPARQECRFHRLTETGLYKQIIPDGASYQTPLLPQFRFHIPILWEENLPDVVQVVSAVRDMLMDE